VLAEQLGWEEPAMPTPTPVPTATLITPTTSPATMPVTVVVPTTPPDDDDDPTPSPREDLEGLPQFCIVPYDRDPNDNVDVNEVFIQPGPRFTDAGSNPVAAGASVIFEGEREYTNQWWYRVSYNGVTGWLEQSHLKALCP
jgi:hypothetical protein